MVFHPVVSRSCPGRVRCSTRWRPPFRIIWDCGAVGVLLVKRLVGLWWGGGVVPVGDSVVASALKKLARTCLLSCHDVFAELVAARASHCLFPSSHQVWGLFLTRFMFVLASIFGECTIRCPSLFSSWCPGGVPVVSRWCPSGVSAV